MNNFITLFVVYQRNELFTEWKLINDYYYNNNKLPPFGTNVKITSN